MMHESYIQLRHMVGERGAGSASVEWPHPSDFNLSPGENPVQELFGLHYVATMSQLGLVAEKFYEEQADGCNVSEFTANLVEGLEEVLARAKQFARFSKEYDRCLSPGPGCTFPCPCQG